MGGCNKITYETKADAVRHGKEIQIESRNRKKEKRPGKPNAAKLWPYECPMCGGWHLTSMSRNKARTYKRKAKKQERINGPRS